MISNPALIFYACIAKGPVVLTHFVSSQHSEIEAVAHQCIEKTPPHHSVFSHTVRNKTYTFLIHHPFAFFLISHDDLPKSESLAFLSRLRIAFHDFVASNPLKDFDDPSYNCFQLQFYPIFCDMLSLDVGLMDSSLEAPKEARNPSMDSTTAGKRSIVRPLLSEPAKLMMKKKKRPPLGCAGCVSDGGEVNAAESNTINTTINGKINHVGENVVSRDFSVSMHKNGGGFYMADGRQKTKQIWRKHVWVVLIIDLFICATLFAIWLWICRGFKCIDG